MLNLICKLVLIAYETSSPNLLRDWPSSSSPASASSRTLPLGGIKVPDSVPLFAAINNGAGRRGGHLFIRRTGRASIRPLRRFVVYKYGEGVGRPAAAMPVSSGGVRSQYHSCRIIIGNYEFSKEKIVFCWRYS